MATVYDNDEMHPDRYGGDTVYECKKVCEAWTKPNEDGYEGWLKNTIIKYLSRFGAKDDKLKEAKKIFNYAKFLLNYEEKKIVVKSEKGPSDEKGSPSKEMKEQPFATVKVGKDVIAAGVFPVTQDIYEEVIGKNPSETKGDRMPVTNVSWFDALSFCNELSERQGLEPCYRRFYFIDEYKCQNSRIECNFKANGYRLPTSEEWEALASGGDSFKYAGSDNLDEVGWYSGDSEGYLHDVGMKKPNGYGLYDMSGNVCEWCWDYDKRIDDYRVIRGGSFYYSDDYCAVAYRGSLSPNRRYDCNGFRLVRSMGKTE